MGGMRNILRTPLNQEDLYFMEKYSFLLGIEIQFPIKNNWFIESGVNLRTGPITYTYMKWDDPGYTAEFIPLKDFKKNQDYTGSDYYVGNKAPGIYTSSSTFIDIPIRAGWKLFLNDNNELQFSIGPTMIFDLERPHVEGGRLYNRNCFSVGLSPSVVYKHRALSLGLYYENPCIYNGSKNRETNFLMFTIGVNINGRKPNLDKIISVLEVTGAVLEGVSNTMGSYSATTPDNKDNTYQKYQKSTKSSTKSVNDKSKDFSISKRDSRNADYRTYFKYEDIVIKILNGDDKRNNKADIQREMKRLRQKWAINGDGWEASEYENK